jgi:hypothetical protein
LQRGQSGALHPDSFQTDPHFNDVILAGKEFFAPAPVKDNWGPRAAWLGPSIEDGVARRLRALLGCITARSQYAQTISKRSLA